MQIHHGDALDVLRTLPDASVDAVVTDPPYELRLLPPGYAGVVLAVLALLALAV